MKNIDLNIKRMLSLLESKMGNVKPLINEQVVPTSPLPKQDWILAKQPKDWLTWIKDNGCITRRPGGEESKIDMTTTATEKLHDTNTNEPLIKVTKFKRINNRGQEIPTNLYILGKKSREGKEGYFKLFFQNEGEKSNQYYEGQLNCSAQYKPETTSVASEVRDVNTEDQVNQILKQNGYTRQLEPGDNDQQRLQTTVKELCKTPGMCTGILQRYAEGPQGDDPIYQMTDKQKDEAVKSGYIKDVDRVKERQTAFNLKRGIKKINKENFTNQSCKTAIITLDQCNTNEEYCGNYVKTNLKLQNMGPNEARMWLSKHIKLCRNNNMYNKKQLADVNDLKLEQTIGKNIRESLKELNLINKIG